MTAPLFVPFNIGTRVKRPISGQLLAKDLIVPFLDRHNISGTYYGTRKLKGKEKDQPVHASGRKVAEPKLKEWMDGLDRTNAMRRPKGRPQGRVDIPAPSAQH